MADNVGNDHPEYGVSDRQGFPNDPVPTSRIVEAHTQQEPACQIPEKIVEGEWNLHSVASLRTKRRILARCTALVLIQIKPLLSVVVQFDPAIIVKTGVDSSLFSRRQHAFGCVVTVVISGITLGLRPNRHNRVARLNILDEITAVAALSPMMWGFENSGRQVLTIELR